MVPGSEGAVIDGSLCWETLGALSRVGVAYATDLLGAPDIEPQRAHWGDDSPLATDYHFRARRGRRYAMRQMASMVPSVLHGQPDRQAIRLAAQAATDGFDEIRRGNRRAWAELWKGRIVLEGSDPHWQQMTDAALYYLFASTHAASPSSTSIFGLAQWTNYHYYYGHIMWDIEAFSIHRSTS